MILLIHIANCLAEHWPKGLSLLDSRRVASNQVFFQNHQSIKPSSDTRVGFTCSTFSALFSSSISKLCYSHERWSFSRILMMCLLLAYQRIPCWKPSMERHSVHRWCKPCTMVWMEIMSHSTHLFGLFSHKLLVWALLSSYHGPSFSIPRLKQHLSYQSLSIFVALLGTIQFLGTLVEQWNLQR